MRLLTAMMVEYMAAVECTRGNRGKPKSRHGLFTDDRHDFTYFTLKLTGQWELPEGDLGEAGNFSPAPEGR